jgi:integrase
VFNAWCAKNGYSDAPPVAPTIVARWLIERADAGASRSTLGVALAAVKFGHRLAGARFDADDPDLQRALSGVRREAVREQRQAAPLRPTVLGDLLAGLGDSDLDRRDAAMLSTLYMLALRRSELVEIDLEKRGDGLAVLRLTDDGLELELLRSKAEQERSAIVAVDRSHNPKAFAALERWISHACIEPGTALFRRINPRGGIGGRITDDGVNRAVKAALRRYYLATGADAATAVRLARRYSGHSGRVGLIVASKEAGAADSDIATLTRHRSLQMISLYGRAADQRRRAPHRLPGVGL